MTESKKLTEAEVAENVAAKLEDLAADLRSGHRELRSFTEDAPPHVPTDRVWRDYSLKIEITSRATEFVEKRETLSARIAGITLRHMLGFSVDALAGGFVKLSLHMHATYDDVEALAAVAAKLRRTRATLTKGDVEGHG